MSELGWGAAESWPKKPRGSPPEASPSTEGGRCSPRSPVNFPRSCRSASARRAGLALVRGRCATPECTRCTAPSAWEEFQIPSSPVIRPVWPYVDDAPSCRRYVNEPTAARSD
ncbi:hypothetical protein KM043_004830 [Ampulex compressa]|nr:hypothetical protein KM043_004830 [Ampulex compressa]